MCELYLVTATHCLAGITRDQELSIQYHLGSGLLLPFSHTAHGDIAGLDDPDYMDITVLRICRERLNEEEAGDLHALTVRQFASRKDGLPEGARLLFVGFPKTDICGVFSEQRQIRTNLVPISAHYRTPSATMSHCHELRFEIAGAVKTISGMSGSPVFYSVQEGNDAVAGCGFAGMMIRGTVESGRGYFIASRVIYEAVHLTHCGCSQESTSAPSTAANTGQKSCAPWQLIELPFLDI